MLSDKPSGLLIQGRFNPGITIVSRQVVYEHRSHTIQGPLWFYKPGGIYIGFFGTNVCGLIRLVVYDLKGLTMQGPLYMVLQDRCLTMQGPLWCYKTVVYEYMGLIIRERAKLTFLV